MGWATRRVVHAFKARGECTRPYGGWPRQAASWWPPVPGEGGPGGRQATAEAPLAGARPAPAGLIYSSRTLEQVDGSAGACHWENRPKAMHPTPA